MQPISTNELVGVLSYLKSLDNPIKYPIVKISGFLLENFGWPTGQGRERASLIIQYLIEGKEIDCARNSRGSLQSISIREKVVPVEPVQLLKRDAPPIIEPPREIIRHIVPKLKSGLARELKAAQEKGDRNEARFHRLVSELLELLGGLFPQKIVSTSCFRSGKNNQRKGKVDLQDRAGEDVVPMLTISSGNGGFDKKRVIYDVKSSDRYAREFNQRVAIRPGQEGASLKKAIVVNNFRSDRDVIAEVLNDFVHAQILTTEMTEVLVVRFSEFAA